MWDWLFGKGASESAVQKMQARLDQTLWLQLRDAMPFLHGLSPNEEAALQHASAWFLASKTWDGAGGLEITDPMALCVAMQASLPILYLGEKWYEGWSGIVIYPNAFVTRHKHSDDAGVSQCHSNVTLGETWAGGPLILAWEAARADHGPHDLHSAHGNVVIHEFAHKLDMAHGPADGMPFLGGTDIDPAHWMETLHAAWKRLGAAVQALEGSMPRNMDPSSRAARRLYDHLPMDPYGAENPVEFFAVSSEVFFVYPEPLARWDPEWYNLLCRFYRQEPLKRLQQEHKHPSIATEKA